MDQARLTTDGIHFDTIEGEAWMNRIFQQRLDKMEVELFETGVLNEEETTNEPALSHATKFQRARAKNGSTGPIRR